MAAEQKSASPTLDHALADLRQIRETLDRSRDNHPIRLVGHALLTLSALVGALIVVYGLAAQLVLSALPHGVGGLGASAILWILSAILMVASAGAKVGVMAAASRRAGFDINKLLASVVTADYMRVLVPIYLLTAVAGSGLVLSGRADMLPGLIAVAFGAVCVAIPAIFPLRELTGIGVVSLGLGSLAMFVLPEWPFLKIALVLGLPLAIGALLQRSAFPGLAAAESPEAGARPGAAVDQG